VHARIPPLKVASVERLVPHEAQLMKVPIWEGGMDGWMDGWIDHWMDKWMDG